VLDPTCGSGAFLFAALEILQPLYLACLERMRVIIADWRSADESHPNWEKEIGAILDQAAAHPNEAYYINKTIIVHNLYGVDIMEEAVEICKLRLFLKLAAQLEPGQAVEPLPDIDFNVRSGNTLVGYASKTEIKKAVENDSSLIQQEDDLEQALMIGVTSDSHLYQTIIEQAEDADRAFQRFHALQEDTQTKPADFRSAKKKLNLTLDILREQLDHFLAADYDQKNLKSDAKLQSWQKSHQPFHWFIEFYGIMNAGGFDVIIGNPPYLELTKVKSYKVKNYRTVSCNNLYAITAERVLQIEKNNAWSGLIIPISFAATNAFEPLREVYLSESPKLWISNFSNRPGQLFTGAQSRLNIVVRSNSNTRSLYSTKYYRWDARGGERTNLLAQVTYSADLKITTPESFPKVSNIKLLELLNDTARRKTISTISSRNGQYPVYWIRVPGYFLQFFDFEPQVEEIDTNLKRARGELNKITFDSAEKQKAFLALLNSSLFLLRYTTDSDGRHINPSDVKNSKVTPSLSLGETEIISSLASELTDRLVETKGVWRKSGLLIDTYNSKLAKSIIDKIDTLLAAHYGFTEAELDFIINYDIKYRMGLGS